MPRNMMDAQEAANYLHISYWTLLNRAKKGQVPCVKVGRRVLFSQEGLDQWIADQEAKSLQQEPDPVNQYGKLRKIKG